MEKEEIVKESKSKGNKILICILCLVIVLLAAAVIYLAFIKRDKEKVTAKPEPNTKVNNNNNNEKPIKNDNRELTDDEISLLMNKVKKYFLFDLRNNQKKITISKDNVTNEMLYSAYYYASSLDDSFSQHWENGNSWSFSTDVADEYFKNAFGFVPKEYKSIMCLEDNIELLYFNKSKSAFVYNDEHPGHGMWPVGYLDYIITDSKKEDNIYTIYGVFLTGNMLDGYYVNGNEFMPENLNDESEPEEFIKEFKKNKDNFSSSSKYILTFEKDGNNYYFKSIELKK